MEDNTRKLNAILNGDAGATSGASVEAGIMGEAGLGAIAGVVGIPQPKQQAFPSGLNGTDEIAAFTGNRGNKNGE